MTSLLRNLVESVAPLLSPPRVIMDREGGTPYLSRWYLSQRPTMPDGSEPFGPDGAPKDGLVLPSGWGLYLHRFHRGDDSPELHNHPWRWAVSLILAGGYVEERRKGEGVVRHTYRPGALNLLLASTFHRVELLERDAWSLFLVGPKVGHWGFWDRHSGRFEPWREYIARIRSVQP